MKPARYAASLSEILGPGGEGQVKPLQVALAEVTGETGGGVVVVFKEGGVAVDVAAEAFS